MKMVGRFKDSAQMCIECTKKENKDETILLYGKAALPLTHIIPVAQGLSFAFYLLLGF